MALLYADENFDHPIVAQLRSLGHDVVTAQQAGQANQGIADPQVLSFATAQGRAVLTFNRRHFLRLHYPAFALPDGPGRLARRYHCLHEG